MFYEVSGYCSQGSDHYWQYCCLLFPKFFYDFQVLLLSNLFHFFLIDSAISWYCHINQPHLLLFFSTTVISGMLWARCLSVWILKSQRILTSSWSFCGTFSTLCSHYLSDAGRWYFLHRFQCSIEATLLWRFL